jgi:Methyltransferase domain
MPLHTTDAPGDSTVEKKNPALVVAPDAVIRFIGGRAVVHSGAGGRMLADEPALLALLSQFAAPATEEAVLSRTDSALKAASLKRIEALKRIGALVPVTADRGASKGSTPPVDAQLAIVADSVQRIAGSLAAFGPKADTLISDKTRLAPGERLLAMVAGVTALEAELNALRPGFIAEQLKALNLTDESKSLKLHLGCGESRLPGWVNIDAYPAELALDLRWGLPFADGSASHVFMSHVFEHLYHPEESSFVAGEIFRVLQPGGRVRLIVPDLELCIKAYAGNDRAFFAGRQNTWEWWNPAATMLEGFLAYGGAGPRASQFLEAHKFGYDLETITRTLTGAGFKDVIRSGYMASSDPSLLVDDASSVAGAQAGEQHYSLFVEATR